MREAHSFAARSWGLTQSFLKSADYHASADAWLSRYKPRTILCFVQFKGVAIGELPRVYLAAPSGVAERLKATARGRGDTILYEEHRWSDRVYGAGTIDRIPEEWRFSEARVYQMLTEAQ